MATLRGDPASLTALSIRLRCLLILTTTPWRPHSSFSPGFMAKTDELQADGWILRGAYWRNHALWNGGRTLREGRAKLVVLPLEMQARSLFEAELLLAHELVRAQLRYEKIGGDDEVSVRLRPFLSSIRLHHGIEFTNLEKRLAALN